MASKLTELAKTRSQLDYVFLGQKSIRWMQENVASLRSPSKLSNELVNESSRLGGKFQMGGLYQFYYDPLTKDKLPIYDIFPLVIPLHRKTSTSGDGFVGLNLHYLPPMARASFLDRLTDFAVYNKDDEIKRLKVTYEILAATERYSEFKQCIKHYLYNQIRSSIVTIKPNEWEVAIFLPTAQFKRKN